VNAISAILASVQTPPTADEIRASIAVANAILDARFADYDAEMRCRHEEHEARARQRQSEVLGACAVAVADARQMGRDTIATLEVYRG